MAKNPLLKVALVRHPEFLRHILIISALAIISQHWISLTIGAILIVLLLFAIAEEEKRNLEKFGSAYRDYMKRVPRLNLLIGLIRRMHRRKENKLSSKKGQVRKVLVGPRI